MKIKAYAKVNLGLKVYKGTTQSKHKIDSVFYLYKKLYNVVKIKKSKDLKIHYIYKTKNKPKREEKLIFNACDYLKKKYGWDVGYEITVIKHIPLGSGLGGSSSEAAAVMNYILSQNNYVTLDLKEIALDVGSDIPFFLTHYQIARVQEFGNIVSPIFDWQPKIKINFNNFDCDTKEIYKALEADADYVSRVNIDRLISTKLYKQHINVVYNDLTKYIILSNSDLAKLYKKFDSHSFFSGTGSSIITLKE